MDVRMILAAYVIAGVLLGVFGVLLWELRPWPKDGRKALYIVQSKESKTLDLPFARGVLKSAEKMIKKKG